MADSDSDSNTKVAFWLVGGVVAAVLVGVLVQAQRAAQPSGQAAVVSAAPRAQDVAPATLVGQVFFDTGQTQVPPEGAQGVQAAAEALGQATGASLVLSGFHDATGGVAANAEVAKRRAMAVRDALLASGVAPERIRLEKPQVTLDGGDPKLARRVDIGLTR